MIVGGENFRPVGVALAPDGSVFITDWVLKDYNVHGKGRIWRISTKQERHLPVDDLSALEKLPIEQLRKKLDSPRLDVRRQAARVLVDRDRIYLQGLSRDVSAAGHAHFEAVWALGRVQGHPTSP